MWAERTWWVLVGGDIVLACSWLASEWLNYTDERVMRTGNESEIS